ncbi:MAG: enoyl-CoA hydratase [Natronomonas sp.]|jgi:enoyl-CoA hydratase
MRDYDCLDVTEGDDVLEVAIDRPDSLNAVNAALHEELSQVFRDAYHADARVVVLTGNGKAFSAGGDVGWMRESIENPETFRETMREGETIIKDITDLEKPLVAKVNGDATGLGATLALFADITVMAESARIGDPHVSVGLVAGDGGAVIWPLLTSMHTAKEMLMTGDLVDAAEAERMGLANYAVPEGELDAKVEELTGKLANGPQAAIRYTKKALNSWVELGNDLALQRGLSLEAVSQQHPDHDEAVDAFLNERRPEFPSASDDDD